jgi:hypothetical protein
LAAKEIIYLKNYIHTFRGYLAPLVTAFGAFYELPQVPLKLLSRVSSYYVSHSTPFGVGAFYELPQVPLKLLSRGASYCVSHSTPFGVGAFYDLPQVPPVAIHIQPLSGLALFTIGSKTSLQARA